MPGDPSVTCPSGRALSPPAVGLGLSLCGAILRVSHGDKISIIQSIYLSGERSAE